MINNIFGKKIWSNRKKKEKKIWVWEKCDLMKSRCQRWITQHFFFNRGSTPATDKTKKCGGGNMPRKLHARMFNSQNRWSKCNDWQLLSPCITTAIKDVQNFYTKSPIYSRTWLVARRVMLSPFNCVDSQFDDDVDPFSQFLTKEFPSYHSGLAHRAAVTSVSHHKHAHNIHPEKKKPFRKCCMETKIRWQS